MKFYFPSHFKMAAVLWIFIAITGVERGLHFTKPLLIHIQLIHRFYVLKFAFKLLNDILYIRCRSR